MTENPGLLYSETHSGKEGGGHVTVLGVTHSGVLHMLAVKSLRRSAATTRAQGRGTGPRRPEEGARGGRGARKKCAPLLLNQDGPSVLD